MEKQNAIVTILKWLLKWRKFILIGTIVAAIFSIVVSLILPVYFKSSARVYAASQDLARPELIYGLSDVPMEYFGSKDDMDRLLSICDGTQFAYKIAKENKLYEHYGIDSTSKKSAIKVYEKFHSNFEYRKSDDGGISMVFYDKAPKKAFDVMQSIVETLQRMGIEIIKNFQKSLIELYEKDIQNMTQKIAVEKDSLSYYQYYYHIIDPSTQLELLATRLEEMTSEFVEAQSKLEYFKSVKEDSARYYKGRVHVITEQLKQLKGDEGDSKIQNFNKGVNAIQTIQISIKEKEHILNRLEVTLQNVKSIYDSYIPSIHVALEPEIPVEKAWPVRSLIVIVSTFLAFVVLSLYALVKEANKDIDWKRILES